MVGLPSGCWLFLHCFLDQLHILLKLQLRVVVNIKTREHRLALFLTHLHVKRYHRRHKLLGFDKTVLAGVDCIKSFPDVVFLLLCQIVCWCRVVWCGIPICDRCRHCGFKRRRHFGGFGRHVSAWCLDCVDRCLDPLFLGIWNLRKQRLQSLLVVVRHTCGHPCCHWSFSHDCSLVAIRCWDDGSGGGKLEPLMCL